MEFPTGGLGGYSATRITTTDRINLRARRKAEGRKTLRGTVRLACVGHSR